MANSSQVKQFIDNLMVDGGQVAKDLGALAKAELTPAAKHAGIGSGMFGGAGYFALNAISLLFLAGAGGFAIVFNAVLHRTILLSLTLGLVAMAIVGLLIAAILALAGRGQIKQVQPPVATIAEAQATLDALKTSAIQGKTVVEDRALTAKAVKAARRALD